MQSWTTRRRCAESDAQSDRLGATVAAPSLINQETTSKAEIEIMQLICPRDPRMDVILTYFMLPSFNCLVFPIGYVSVSSQLGTEPESQTAHLASRRELMTNSLIRLAYTVLFSCTLAAATETACMADVNNVLVTFAGTGSDGKAFSGYFEYDQTQSKVSDYHFNFDGSSKTHMICYSYSGGTCSGTGVTSQPFCITTSSAGSFVLTSTCEASGNSVTISFTLTSGCTATALPVCIFPQNGAFSITGNTTYTGTINKTSCATSTTGVLACTCPPTYTAPGPPLPPSGPPQCPPPPCYVYVCAAPPPCPVYYACQPRPACCLSRLFGRRCR